MYSESVNKWINIRGRKILCEEFIRSLDKQRHRLPSHVNDKAFARAISVLQDCTE